jgi:G:T-mismatch repair DNA endonuclease (very short patch repair protein)
MISLSNICKCGCGQPCRKLYKKGHARKNKPMSESHKLKIALSNTGKNTTQETLDKIKKTKLEKGIFYRKHTEEEKLHQSILAKQKGVGLWMKDKKRSVESIEKGRIKALGRTISELTREKIYKNTGENNGMYKRGHTEEAKIKISEAAKLMWEDKNCRDRIMNHPNRILSARKGAFAVQVKYPNGKFTDTKPEKEMAEILSKLEISYKQSYPFSDLKNPYLADFFIENMKIIIEVDGKYWHNYPNYLERDILRTRELQENGYLVLRYWEGEFNLEVVEKDIDRIVEGKHKLLFI